MFKKAERKKKKRQVEAGNVWIIRIDERKLRFFMSQTEFFPEVTKLKSM